LLKVEVRSLLSKYMTIGLDIVFFIYYCSVEVDVMTCPRILITAISAGNPTLCGLRDKEL